MNKLILVIYKPILTTIYQLLLNYFNRENSIRCRKLAVALYCIADATTDCGVCLG